MVESEWLRSGKVFIVIGFMLIVLIGRHLLSSFRSDGKEDLVIRNIVTMLESVEEVDLKINVRGKVSKPKVNSDLIAMKLMETIENSRFGRKEYNAYEYDCDFFIKANNGKKGEVSIYLNPGNENIILLLEVDNRRKRRFLKYYDNDGYWEKLFIDLNSSR